MRADSQNLRGNPPIKKTQDLQGGLPRSHSLARNDTILDSSLRLRFAQNDKIKFSQNNKVDCHADSANLLAMTENKEFAESSTRFCDFKAVLARKFI